MKACHSIPSPHPTLHRRSTACLPAVKKLASDTPHAACADVTTPVRPCLGTLFVKMQPYPLWVLLSIVACPCFLRTTPNILKRFWELVLKCCSLSVKWWLCYIFPTVWSPFIKEKNQSAYSNNLHVSSDYIITVFHYNLDFIHNVYISIIYYTCYEPALSFIHALYFYWRYYMIPFPSSTKNTGADMPIIYILKWWSLWYTFDRLRAVSDPRPHFEGFLVQTLYDAIPVPLI